MYSRRQQRFAAAGLAGVAVAAVAWSAFAQSAAQASADPREQGVRELIDRYFLTWSAADMDRYGQCFMPQAVDPAHRSAGALDIAPLAEISRFAARRASRQARGHERNAETVEVRFEGELARVVVYWKLVAGAETQFGYDHYTLMESGGKWRIANLIFYETPPKGAH